MRCPPGPRATSAGSTCRPAPSWRASRSSRAASPRPSPGPAPSSGGPRARRGPGRPARRDAPPRPRPDVGAHRGRPRDAAVGGPPPRARPGRARPAGQRGDARQAAGLAADVVALADSARLGRDRVEARLLLGRALVDLGDLDQATTTYLTALEHCRTMRLPLRAADVLDGLAGWPRPRAARGAGARRGGLRAPHAAQGGALGLLRRLRRRAGRPGARGVARRRRPVRRGGRASITAVFNRPASAPPSVLDALTAAERQVAERVAHGLTSRQIAEELFVSPRTVDAHLTHIYRKLDINTRARLAALVSTDRRRRRRRCWTGSGGHCRWARQDDRHEPDHPGDLRRPRPRVALPLLGRRDGLRQPATARARARAGPGPLRRLARLPRPRSACRSRSGTPRPRPRTPTATDRGCSSSGCPRARRPRTASTSTSAPRPGSRATSGWPRWRPRAERLVALGATRVERHEPAPPMTAGHIVMTDPEGNEFCLD